VQRQEEPKELTCQPGYRIGLHLVLLVLYLTDMLRHNHISCKDGILEARGVCISSVNTVGQLSGMDDMHDYYHAIKAFHAWHIFLTTKLGYDAGQSEDFSRLLLCDIIEPVMS
jgi:hypothetical protein